MSCYSHGDKIERRLIQKNQSTKTIALLKEVKAEYCRWKKSNLDIIGTSKRDIEKKVSLFNEYKSFLTQAKIKKGFTSQSQFHSSVLEEFMYYLFKDINKLSDKHLIWGTKRAYTNLYFTPSNIKQFKDSAKISVDKKQLDFAILTEVIVQSKVTNKEEWVREKLYIPIVAIECKTYLDKTMYEGSVSTADKIKKGNPYCVFLIVTETYDLSSDFEPKTSSIDQIYVLRKESEENPIFADVVLDLFHFIETHINAEWFNLNERIKKGKMI